MVVWTLWLSLAWADAPDKTAAEFEAGAGGPVGPLFVSADANVALGITSDDQVLLVDTRTWTSGESRADEIETSRSNCTVNAATAYAKDDGYFVFLACEQGDVQTWRWNNGKLKCHGGDDPATECKVFAVGERPLVGIWAVGDDTLYVLEEKANSELVGRRLVVGDEGDVSEDASYGGEGVFHNGFVQAVPLRDSDGEAQSVIVFHGSQDFSTWNLAAGTVVRTVAAAGLQVSPTDLAPGATQGAYFTERSEGRISLFTGNSTASFQVVRSDLDRPDALVRTYNDDLSRFVVAEASAISVFPDETSAADASFDIDYVVEDLVEGPGGYVFAGTDDGRVAVLTANPWVSSVTLSPANAVSGTTVTASFEVDEPGSWRLYRGGDRTGSGESLTSGSVDAAGAVTATFTVDDTYDEGITEIWVVHTGQGDGNKGYALAELTVDNAPSSLALTQRNIGFGNKSLYLDFYGDAADDIVGYDVYVSKTPFSAADYASGGGPEGTVDGITSPVRVDQPESGIRVVARIAPLKNNQLYYVAVRAVDSTAEGPMSDVVSETPRPTLTAADLASDDGSYCATGGSPTQGAGWLALLGLGMVARRRRRGTGAVAAGLVVVSAMLVSAPAQAQQGSFLSRFENDLTPVWANFEFHAGAFQFDDPNFTTIYGSTAPAFELTAGPQLWRYGEIDLGIGIIPKKGNTVDSSGASSKEEVRLDLLPLSLSATLRAHILDEQPVVPYASVGLDYVFWFEQPLDELGARVKGDGRKGGKMGWHWAVGGNILLDIFGPRRASQLEATTGINDTWLVIEYRRSYIGQNTTGLDLSGWSISGGLKLDY